jgi:hypothetical protein
MMTKQERIAGAVEAVASLPPELPAAAPAALSAASSADAAAGDGGRAGASAGGELAVVGGREREDSRVRATHGAEPLRTEGVFTSGHGGESLRATLLAQLTHSSQVAMTTLTRTPLPEP